MDEKKIKLKDILIMATLGAGAYYLAGPVGFAVLALFVVLKKF